MDQIRSVQRGGSDRSYRRVERGEQVSPEVCSEQVVRPVPAQREEVETAGAEAARSIYSPEGYATRGERPSGDPSSGLYQTQRILERYRAGFDHYEECTVVNGKLVGIGGKELMGVSELHILVRKEMGFWGDALSLMIYEKNPMNQGMVGVASPLVFTQYAEGTILPTDMSLGGMKMESATRLMDSLWDAGVRPSRAMPGHDMEIALLKAHVEDLRKLLWNRIGMEAQ